MKRKIATTLAAGALLASAAALAPIELLPGPLTPAPAAAAVTKSLSAGGGGGNVSGVGTRLGSLAAAVAVPVVIVVAGCMLIGALATRNIGGSVGIVVITLLGLIFLLAPQSIEALAKGIATTVF